MKNANVLNVIVKILLIVGGLNWGLVGLFNFDVLTGVFGEAFSRVIFVVIGLAALYKLIMWLRKASHR